MKVSFRWLQRYLALEDKTPEQIAAVLPSIGIEVASVERKGLPFFNKVVVGKIVSCEKHPNADRLTVCQVCVELEGEPLQIVCGATNHKVGDYVPVALPGAHLSGDFQIRATQVRGVDSSGMLCSGDELGLQATKGLLILAGAPAIGTPINEVFEDEEDFVFEIELTPNRGDCLSHLGVARELAAVFEKKLQYPEVPSVSGEGSLEVIRKSPHCAFYTAWSVQGVTVGPSPDWLQKDLTAVGLRPINNIVDITNWVMLECGQPLHAFDAAHIRGGKIIIREAENEKLTTLDGEERLLSPGMMVIADEERPLAVAGVMGGLEGQVVETTTDLLLESAWFAPSSIRRTARILGLSTDGSHRFARDVDPAGVPWAARRALSLIQEIAGGKCVGFVSSGGFPRRERKIRITKERICRLCGFVVQEEDIVRIYQNLEFLVETVSEGVWEVTVPSFRSEIERPVDLVEEFVRIFGTNRIPESFVQVKRAITSPLAIFNSLAAAHLVAQGFWECVHYSLRREEEVRTWYGEPEALALENPLTVDYTHLRPSLLPGLLDGIKLNRDRGNTVCKLFERGRVFRFFGGKTWELASVAFVFLAGSAENGWCRREAPDFYTVKNILEGVIVSSGLCPSPSLKWKPLRGDPVWQEERAAFAGGLEKEAGFASVGTLSLSMLKAWDLNDIVLAGEWMFVPEALPMKRQRCRFQPISSFPPVVKDLALLVDCSVPAESVRHDLQKIAKEVVGDAFFVESVELFDLYTGPEIPAGQKSLAFSLRFRSDEETLATSVVHPIFSKIQNKINEHSCYRVRC